MRIEQPPVVVGAAVSLRPIEPSDVDAWYAYLTMPGVLANTSWALRDRSELIAAIDRYLSMDPATPVRYAIVDQADASLIGTIGLPLVSWIHRTAEVAYDLRPSNAGRGIATACCRAVTEWLLRDHGFFRVQAIALETNAASIRVLEKSGFSLEGRLANYRTVRGTPRNFFLYAKTKVDLPSDLRES